MKKVIGMLALVALVGNIANAELLKNFKYDGKVEVVGVVVNNSNDFNKDAGDKFSDVKTRVSLNAGFDLNEDVNAVVSVVKDNRNYGAGTNLSEDANTVQSKLFFDQTYLNLKGVFGMNHKVGRQYYGNNGDIIVYFGPQDWYVHGFNFQTFHNMYALDGWTANWNKDKWSATGLIGKAVEAGGVTSRDADAYGLTASYDYSEIVKPTVYYYESKDYANATRLNDVQVAGIKANGEYKGVKYGAEYAMNMGQNRNIAAPNTQPVDYKGYAVKANAAYGIDLAGKLGFDAEFAMGSGDKDATDTDEKSFQDINANYRPGLIMGGMGVSSNGVAKNDYSVTSLNNLTTWNIGANWTPSKVEKLNLGVKYYDFSYTEKQGTVEHFGTEADLVATWTHSENVSLKLGLGMFMPDEFKLATKDDSVYLGTLAMNVKF